MAKQFNCALNPEKRKYNNKKAISIYTYLYLDGLVRYKIVDAINEETIYADYEKLHLLMKDVEVCTKMENMYGKSAYLEEFVMEMIPLIELVLNKYFKGLNDMWKEELLYTGIEHLYKLARRYMFKLAEKNYQFTSFFYMGVRNRLINELYKVTDCRVPKDSYFGHLKDMHEYSSVTEAIYRSEAFYIIKNIHKEMREKIRFQEEYLKALSGIILDYVQINLKYPKDSSDIIPDVGAIPEFEFVLDYIKYITRSILKSLKHSDYFVANGEGAYYNIYDMQEILSTGVYDEE